MQRISFKHVVCLALLVMSISLVPSAIVHSAPDGTGGAVLPTEPNDPAPTAGSNSVDNLNAAGAKNGEEPSTNDAGVEELETVESLRHDLEQVKAELKKAKETSLPFDIRFGVSLEIILAAAALLVSVVSIVLSWFLFRDLVKDLKRIKASLNHFKQQTSLKFGGIETEQERLTQQLKADVESVQKKQDVFEAASALNNQPSPFQSPPPQSPLSTSSFPAAMATNALENRAPSLTVAGLIRAINTGDRQVLREATAAELNITSASENTIAMGMSEATELEEVSAGGSYLLASLEGRTLLFPTDRTLRGFSTTQPSKGLYSYEQQSVSKAEIIEPAVLEKSGAVWRVSQKGRVAIP